MFRHLFGVMGQLLGAGWAVELMNDTDGGKKLPSVGSVGGILSDCVLAEAAFRIGPMLDKPLPSFIGPGAGSVAHERKRRFNVESSETILETRRYLDLT